MTDEQITPATEEATGTNPEVAPEAPVESTEAESPVEPSTEGAVPAPTEEGKE